jgi:hypothetical protein
VAGQIGKRRGEAPCCDTGDGKLVRVAETDVTNIERERAAAAVVFA